MSSIIKFISKLFGNKYDKDIKSIMPIIESINTASSKLKSISNDQLRHKTTIFQDAIFKNIENEKNNIIELKQKAKLKETSTNEKDIIYKKIDELEKTIFKKNTRDS